MHTERQRGYHSYEVGRSEVRMPGKASVFFFLLRILPHRRWALTSPLFNGYRCYVPGERQPGHEVDRSPPSNNSGVTPCIAIEQLEFILIQDMPGSTLARRSGLLSDAFFISPSTKY